MSKQPVTRFQAGAVNASVWESRGKSGMFLTVTVNRSYKDAASGEWKRSDSYALRQLDDLIDVAQRAREYLRQNAASAEDAA